MHTFPSPQEGYEHLPFNTERKLRRPTARLPVFDPRTSPTCARDPMLVHATRIENSMRPTSCGEVSDVTDINQHAKRLAGGQACQTHDLMRCRLRTRLRTKKETAIYSCTTSVWRLVYADRKGSEETLIKMILRLLEMYWVKRAATLAVSQECTVAVVAATTSSQSTAEIMAALDSDLPKDLVEEMDRSHDVLREATGKF